MVSILLDPRYFFAGLVPKRDFFEGELPSKLDPSGLLVSLVFGTLFECV